MMGGLILTALIFVIAVTLCLVINFAVAKYVWDGVPMWVQYISLFVCVVIIFFIAYQAIAQLWGAV